MKNRFLKSSICALTITVIIAALVFVKNGITYVNAYGYNSNVLVNPTPSNTSGWTLTKCEWNDGSYGGEFKGTSNDPMYASQRFTFSARDIYRINNGEIKIDASGYFWAQASCTMWAYLKTTFYNGSGANIGNKTVNYDSYSVTKHNEQLSFSDYTVPRGTTYLVFEAKSDDSLSGYHPSFRQFVLKVKDSTAPTYIVTSPVTSPNKYKVGTTIRYQVQFTEPVNVATKGYIKFKVGTQEFNTHSIYTGQSADGTTLYYDFTLPSTSTLGDNMAVSVTGLSGIVVSDDAGNSTTVNKSLSLSNGFYVDNKPPEVSSFTTTASTNAVYKAGETLQFDVTFHENIWVNGTPKINLSNGKSADYIRQTATDTRVASFYYTIANGDDKENIAITSVDFSGIYDSVSNYATSSPSYNASAYNSFLSNKYVSIDTIAPITTFPTVPDGWQKAYDIVLSPTDNISGVREIYAVWTPVNGTPVYPPVANVDTSTNNVMLPGSSGIYQLHVKLKDNVNNEAIQKSPYTYYIDFDAPVISAEATKIIGTDLISSVTATATDSHSGLSTFTYMWKNANNITILTGNASEDISIPTEDGIYTLAITATDKLGNTDTKTIENLAVDSIAPLVSFTQAGGAIYKTSYKVDFTVADEKSGVSNYYYIWNTSAVKPDADSEAWVTTTATSLTTPSGVSGTYYLHIKAVDNAGNMGITSTDGFNIDNAAPNISITPDGNEGHIGQVSYDVAVSIGDEITAYDDLTKKYVISESETCPADLLDLTDSFITIENLDKTKYLYIVAIDAAGNETVFKSSAFIADISSPAGSITKTADIYYTNKNNATVNIEAVDDYSDSIYMQIKIDDTENQWEDYTEQKTFSFAASEGEHIIYARFKDVCGNVSEYKNVKYYYDITPPEIQLNYSTTALTNSAVTVTASATDNVSDATFETVSEKTFNENGSFEFVAVDKAGNRKRAEAIVDYIDKVNPQISFTSDEFDGKKHKLAHATINASDTNGISELKYAVVRSGEAPEGYITCTNGQSVHITGVDGTYTVIAIAVDNAGNSVTVTSQNIYLDNTAPTAAITYSPTARTSKNVIASITFNEKTTITNNEGLNTYTFADNGSFTFEYTDEAGNTGTAAATVDWIDKNPPEVSITLKNDNGDTLSGEQWTNKDVIAEINIPVNCVIETLEFDGASIGNSPYVTDLGSNRYKISKFGRLVYTVIDTEIETLTSGEVVIRIDKTAPTINNISYSATNWTNMDVTATITATDDYNDVYYVNGNKHIFTGNGEFEFIVEDSLGNRTTQVAKVSNIDKDVPVAEVSYNNTELTNQNVTATVSFNEGGSPVSIINNNGLNTYVFTGNGEFTFEFSDTAGNVGSITAAVSNIDKTPPEINISSDEFDLKPHKNVSATVSAADANGIREMKYRFIKAGENTDYQSCENGGTVTLNSANYVDGTYTLEVKAYDNAGNERTFISGSLTLDNTAPVALMSYAPSSRTAQNVVASISFNEEAIVTNNNGLYEYTFDDNGEFVFEFSDIAGNTGTMTATVDWIDRNQPIAAVILSNENWTTEDVIVSLTPQDGAVIKNVRFNNAEIAEAAENQYIITEYGILTYEVMDLTTEVVGTGEVLIRIDRTVPAVINVAYSTEKWTNRDVTVNITASDNLSPVMYENGSGHVFTENGSYDFIVKDSAGNTTTKTVIVDWIDKAAPVAQISYNTTNLTNRIVTATISFDEDGSPVNVINNNGSRTYEFTANGQFTFEFTDAAGNEGTALASVSNIDKVLPEISLISDNFNTNKYKSASVTINATDLNGITSLKYKFIKVGESGGEFITIKSGDTVVIDGVDGTYQVIAIAEDIAGNIKTVTSQNLYLDNTAPVAAINYTPKTRTAQNVVATITFNETTTITNNGSSANYTFTESGSFTFEFQDELGNSGSYVAAVDWIDRTIPSSKIIITNSSNDVISDSWANEDVIVSIIPSAFAAVEDVRFNGVSVSSSGLITDIGNNRYQVSGYGKLTYILKDIDTHLAYSGETMIRVDKTAPSITAVNYSSNSWTNQNVSVVITAEDDLGALSYPNGLSHVFTENGSYSFIVKDSAGNTATKTVTVDWIDKEAPKAMVTYYVDSEKYDTAVPTNKNVVAKITFDGDGSPVFVTNNSGSMEHEFSSNGSFTFMLKDQAGNEGSAVVTVSKIDKVAPAAYITYSYTGWTNNNVIATLITSDDANEVIITNNLSDSYTFTENGAFTFEFKDSAGNTANATATVTKIDKIAPKLSYELSTEEKTAFGVYAFVNADEPVTIINNGGKTSRQFNSNGEFTFIAKDRAGNTGEITVTVTNISKETTPVILAYSNTDATNQDVYVTVEPEDGSSYIYITNNNGQKVRKFTENGEFTFTYKNAAGIEGEAAASVSNIDKVLPVIDVTYSHSEVTKDNVIATFSVDKEVTYPYIIINGKYTFTENTKLQVPVKDKVGNITNVIIETALIDKIPPEFIIENQYEVLKIGSKFDAKAGVTVTDDTGLDGEIAISGNYDLNTAGNYVINYTATDKAGNVSAAYKYLTVYDPNKFNVIVNGRMAIGGQITINSREINIETINSRGNVTVKRLINKKNIGDFKTKGDVIEFVSKFPSEGYYTLYITDDERNSCLVYVFITE